MTAKTEEGTVWTVPAGKVSAVFTKLGSRLAGDGARVIIQLDDDESFRNRVAEFMLRGGFNPTTSQNLARSIIGKGFLGVEDAIKHFGVQLAPAQKKQLADIPFSEDVLRECAKTHILFPGLPITVVGIRAKMPEKHFYSQDWYNGEPFAISEQVAARWYLLRKEAVSFGRAFSDQQEFLFAEEEIPRACEVVYGVMLYERIIGTRLFENYYVRCRDISSLGHRVGVGGFGSGGLNVVCWDGDDSSVDVGLAVSRKIQSQG